MRKRECFTLFSVLMLLISVGLVMVSALLYEKRVEAQTSKPTVLTAGELLIVDQEGSTRIRLAVDRGLSTIEILDQSGEVVWQAPPRGWAAVDASSKPQVYVDVGSGHWIQTVLDGGRVVILEDGSRWEIEPLNQSDTILWAPTSPITVSEADSPLGDFRYVLTNTEETQNVLAKYLGRR